MQPSAEMMQELLWQIYVTKFDSFKSSFPTFKTTKKINRLWNVHSIDSFSKFL